MVASEVGGIFAWLINEALTIASNRPREHSVSARQYHGMQRKKMRSSLNKRPGIPSRAGGGAPEWLASASNRMRPLDDVLQRRGLRQAGSWRPRRRVVAVNRMSRNGRRRSPM